MLSTLQAVSGTGSSVANASSLLSSSPGKSEGSPFGDLLRNAMGNISHLEDQTRAAVNGLMTGSGVDVHEVMIASEKASMAFELALAVRNKAIQSYQSVMSMQF